MVRLKELYRAEKKFTNIIFQFHYGSIEGRSSSPSTLLANHFNSIMVRLKEIQASELLLDQGDFNSTMVRLKDVQQRGNVSWRFYFNSTMVRLKELIQQARLLLKLFQFHYGSIEGRNCGSIVSGSKISIPLWFD